MESGETSVIDVVEAAYDLDASPGEWLPRLLERGAPLFDRGLGCAGAIWARGPKDERSVITQLYSEGEPGAPPKPRRRASPARTPEPGVRARSEAEAGCRPMLRAMRNHVRCEDVLGLWAIDPDFHGVEINMPSATPVTLSRVSRGRWQRIGTHIATGHRLRRKLAHADGPEALAQAVVDPKDYRVAHATGPAKDAGVREMLRQAARDTDRARAAIRRSQPDVALALWEALVRGKWSMVDCFDRDGRRYMMVIPNSPGCRDPRGLTDREVEVATRVSRGHSCKRIGYDLGISRQRVSALLKGVMCKLCVKNQAQLVVKMRSLGAAPESAA